MGDHDPTLGGVGGGDVLELQVELADARGYVHMEARDLHGIAKPLKALAIGRDDQPRHLVELVARRMATRHPAGEQQSEGAGAGHRHRLMDAEDPPVEIGGVHAQLEGSGIGCIAGRGDRRGGRSRLRQLRFRPDGRGAKHKGGGGVESALQGGRFLGRG